MLPSPPFWELRVAGVEVLELEDEVVVEAGTVEPGWVEVTTTTVVWGVVSVPVGL